jgi:hypothetical protein
MEPVFQLTSPPSVVSPSLADLATENIRIGSDGNGLFVAVYYAHRWHVYTDARHVKASPTLLRAVGGKVLLAMVDYLRGV